MGVILLKYILRGSLVLSCVLLVACQPQVGRATLAPGKKLQITRSVWSDFENYKTKLGRGGGAFVVEESGTVSGYSYCPGDRCRPGSYTQHAIELCENAGVKCLVFAQGRSIQVPYEIVD